MAELFGVQVPAISKHLKKIFEEGELDEKVVISKTEITSPHGAIPDKIQTSESFDYTKRIGWCHREIRKNDKDPDGRNAGKRIDPQRERKT